MKGFGLFDCKVMPLQFEPLQISLTIIVPDAVPSLFHNSCPVAVVVAAKKSVLFTTVRWLGELPGVPLLMFFTITVPEAVPSLFHLSLIHI